MFENGVRVNTSQPMWWLDVCIPYSALQRAVPISKHHSCRALREVFKEDYTSVQGELATNIALGTTAPQKN